VRRAALALASLALAACPAGVGSRDPDPGLVTIARSDAGAPLFTLDQVLTQSCQACHSLKLVEQQRLSEAQWVAVLKKMNVFGASITESAVQPMAAQLAARHGPQAKLPALARVDAAAAVASLLPLAEGAFASDDAKGGEALYLTRCLACHGADARGATGVNLVDRVLLQRAPEFAAHVRTGRGLMPPQAELTDPQLGMLLAYLRTK
jgi:mono/diheme cytochrome c family protein